MPTRLLYRLLLPGLVLAFYFLAPVGQRDAPIGIWFGSLIALICVGGVVAILIAEVRRAEHRLQPIHLVLALEFVVVGFAIAYYILAHARPDELSGLSTRIDALYFSLTTTSTVGFGDIAATGQIGRALVAFQMAFNLVFIAGLVAMFQDRIRARSWQTSGRHRDAAEVETEKSDESGRGD